MLDAFLKNISKHLLLSLNKKNRMICPYVFVIYNISGFKSLAQQSVHISYIRENEMGVSTLR